MKKILVLLLACVGIVYSAFCCTTFFINHNGEMVFGRNYDWVTGAGMICTNQRGLSKTSMQVSDGNTISWTSLYGSISFNQYGKEFPTGGMNERGLVVELMWLDETRYPRQDNRPALGVLQWIQYQLDNSATVDELIASDKKIRITTTSTPLHYLVSDASGNVAAIEFLDGQMMVHKGYDLPFPVLTNSTYKESKQLGAPRLTNNYESFQNNSIQRFEKACSMVKQFEENKISASLTDHAFDILNKVAQGDHTKWSIVYDLKNKVIRFKTRDFNSIKLVRFSAFDFSCSIGSKAFNMNQTGKDDVSTSFILFNKELNREIVEKACLESSLEVQISPKSRNDLVDYFSTVICNGAANKPRN